MPDNLIQENREDRYGKTERKHVSLMTETIEAVQAYADRHGLYFSVAVESLVLMGLQQAPAETLPRLVNNLLERALNRQFNRFAKLIAYAAIAAEEVNYKTDVLLLQTIWREARLDPERFHVNMAVSLDPNRQPDARARVAQARDQRSASGNGSRAEPAGADRDQHGHPRLGRRPDQAVDDRRLPPPAAGEAGVPDVASSPRRTDLRIPPRRTHRGSAPGQGGDVQRDDACGPAQVDVSVGPNWADLEPLVEPTPFAPPTSTPIDPIPE